MSLMRHWLLSPSRKYNVVYIMSLVRHWLNGCRTPLGRRCWSSLSSQCRTGDIGCSGVPHEKRRHTLADVTPNLSKPCVIADAWFGLPPAAEEAGYALGSTRCPVGNIIGCACGPVGNIIGCACGPVCNLTSGAFGPVGSTHHA